MTANDSIKISYQMDIQANGRQPSLLGSKIVEGITLFLILSGSAGCLIDVLYLNVSWPVFIVMAAVISVWYTVVFASSRTMKLLIPATCLILGLILYFNWTKSLNGLGGVINSVIMRLSDYYNTPLLYVSISEYTSNSLLWGMGWLFTLIGFLLCIPVFLGHCRFHIIFYTGWIWIGALLFGEVPGVLSFVFLLCGYISFFLLDRLREPFNRKRSSFFTRIPYAVLKDHPIKRTVLIKTVLAVQLCLIIFLASAFFLASDSLMGGLVSYKPSLTTYMEEEIWSGKFIRENKIIKYFQGMIEDTEYVGNNSITFNGTEMLHVTITEKPSGTLYLKNFVASEYNSGAWSVASDELFSSSTGLSEADARSLFNTSFELADIQATLLNQNAVTVTIEPRLEQSTYLYMPYAVQLPADLSVSGDGAVKTGDNTGAVTWTGYPFMAGSLSGAANYATVSDELTLYEDYVYTEYLKIPESGLEQLREYCEGLPYGDVEEVKAGILNLLSEMQYSTNLESLPPGMDICEYFLFYQKRGYCVHFASSAVLLFRMAGIPARYVSGYAVPAGDFSATETGAWEAAIKDELAHAWVEFYRPGVGWVPLEVTVGGLYSSPEQETETVNNEQESVAQIMEEAKDTASVPDETESGGEADGNTGSFIAFLGSVLPVLLVLVLIFGTVYLRTRILTTLRKRLVIQKNRNKAVLAMAKQVNQWLQYTGYTENEDKSFDLAYAKAVQSKLAFLEPGEFIEFTGCAQEAAFGGTPVSEERAKACFKLYRFINHALYQELSTAKRMIWKWGMGYYI